MKRIPIALTVVALVYFGLAHAWKNPDRPEISAGLVAAETERGSPQPPAVVGHPAFMSPHD